MNWIDIEQQRPIEGQRVIILIPFGMRVEDDTWTTEGWLNTGDYVSHWQPIDPPGTYEEIMNRPRGEPLPVPDRLDVQAAELAKSGRIKCKESIFSEAIREHLRMMESLMLAQFKLRWEMRKADEQKGDV